MLSQLFLWQYSAGGDFPNFTSVCMAISLRLISADEDSTHTHLSITVYFVLHLQKFHLQKLKTMHCPNTSAANQLTLLNVSNNNINTSAANQLTLLNVSNNNINTSAANQLTLLNVSNNNILFVKSSEHCEQQIF